MDKFSSIRVSGGLPLSLLTRGISIQIDSLKLDFILSADKVQQGLERDLAAFYARVDWPKSPIDALHVQCSDSNRDAMNWRKDVEGCIEQFVEQIVVRSIPLTSKKYMIQQLVIPQKVLIKEDDDARLVFVVGVLEFVDKIILQIKELEIENLSRESNMEIRLSENEIFLLMNSGIKTRIAKSVHSAKCSFELPQKIILLHGSEEALRCASIMIANERYMIKERLIGDISPIKIYLLRLKKTKRHVCKKIAASKALCYLDTSHSDVIKLYSFTEKDLNKSENLLRTTIVEETVYIEGDPTGSISPLEYTPMFKQIECRFHELVKIDFVPIELTVRIVAIVDHIHTLRKEVEAILLRGQVFEVADFYRPCVLRYIFKTRAEEFKRVSNKHNVVVLTNMKLSAIKVKGKLEAINCFRQDVEQMIQTITLRRHGFSLPSEYRTMLLDMCSNLETQLNCTVDVLNLSEGPEEKTKQRKVIVMTGMLSKVECDVLLVYSNKKYNHTTQQSKMVVKTGGKTITKECKEYLKEKGEPDEWTVTATGAGKLRNCLAVYHIISPNTGSGSSELPNSVVSLKAAYSRCFCLLEKQKFRSLALSLNRTLAISHQVQTLTCFLKEYFAFNTDSGIRTVVLCDERETVNSFLSEFLASKVPWTCRMEGQLQHNIVSYSIKPGLDWDTTPICHVSSSFTFGIGPLKVRGLVSDITNLRVDAIVNSCNKSLDLRKGAVSQNILIKGGPSLEKQLNSAENRRGILKHGMAVTTSEEMPQIHCKFIYHVDAATIAKTSHITAEWRKMVVKCLMKAEEMRLSSLAFPALGTGSLHGDLRNTAQFMLEAMEEFANKRPQHLTHICIAVLEQHVLEELHDGMRGRYIENMKLWNPEYEEKMRGDILISGESPDILEEATRSFSRALCVLST